MRTGVGVELTVTVSGGDTEDAFEVMGDCAVFLTRVAQRVTVPAHLYSPIREFVADHFGTSRARRLERDSA